MTRTRPMRVGIFLAAGVLLLDGVLTVLAGIWMDRVWLLIVGALFVVAGVGVILLWRRWRRTLQELEQAREALRREQAGLEELVRRAYSSRQ